MGCYRTVDLFLCAIDLFVALVYLMHCLLELCFELRHFENCESLSLLDDIADVDVDFLDVTSDLGVDLDVLVGKKLAGDGELVGDGLTLNDGNSGAARGRGVGGGGLMTAGGRGADKAERKQAGCDGEQSSLFQNFHGVSLFSDDGNRVRNEPVQQLWSLTRARFPQFCGHQNSSPTRENSDDETAEKCLGKKCWRGPVEVRTG